jgi:hypothetical protein
LPLLREAAGRICMGISYRSRMESVVVINSHYWLTK